MRAFAQKPNQPQQKSSANLTRSNALAPAAGQKAHPLLHLQRTIGNQAAQRLLQARAAGLEAGSDNEVGATTEVRSEIPTTTRSAHDFSRIPVHAPASITIQPKLAVNTPGDIYEQEADHVAEQVMRMPEPKLQRACSCGGGCPNCQTEQPDQEHSRLQTKHVGSSDSGQTTAPPIVHEVLASPGQPLDASTRALFEPRFGHDFSRVRVHSDTKAAESALNIGALAYTVGHNIIFARGQYAPATMPGKKLMVHELAHVMQQAGSGKAVQRAPQNPKLEFVSQNAKGQLKANERRAASSCPITCGGAQVGTLHAMPLEYKTWKPNPASTDQNTKYTSSSLGDIETNTIVVAFHFVKETKGRSACACNDFKIIQVATREDGKSFVDVNTKEFDQYALVASWVRQSGLQGLDTSIPPPYYADWANNRKGRDEDEIPTGYPDAGEKVNAAHSIYDRPALNDRKPGGIVSWKAEARVVCQRGGKNDKILGGISYGMSRNSTDPMKSDPFKCLDARADDFLKTLSSDPRATEYKFEGRTTPPKTP